MPNPGRARPLAQQLQLQLRLPRRRAKRRASIHGTTKARIQVHTPPGIPEEGALLVHWLECHVQVVGHELIGKVIVPELNRPVLPGHDLRPPNVPVAQLAPVCIQHIHRTKLLVLVDTEMKQVSICCIAREPPDSFALLLIVALHRQDIGDQLPHVPIMDLPALPLDALVVVVQRVLIDLLELPAQHQVITRIDVLVVPDIQDVGLLAVNRDGDHESNGPRGWAQGSLVLPALLLGATHDPKRPDAVAHDPDQVIEGHPRRRLPARPLPKVLAVNVAQELVPEVASTGRTRLVAQLKAGQEVIHGGQIDQGVHGRAEGAPANITVHRARAKEAVLVQA